MEQSHRTSHPGREGRPGRPPTLLRLARAVAGAVLGTAAGLGVGLGIVVYRARYQNIFLESMNDAAGWIAVPMPVGLVAGAVAGWVGWRLLATGAIGILGGAAVGALAGWFIGAATSPERAAPWAGATMGGAAGILLGLALGLVGAAALRRRALPPPRGGTRPGPASAALLLAVPLLAGGCGGDLPELPEVPPAPPLEAEDVESVVLAFGDPGRTDAVRLPILRRVAAEVEEWSRRLERDSSVIVLSLGDIVYPEGVHDPGTSQYRADSARVAFQVDVVRGREALRHGARMFFVAGNHDWGLMEDRVGSRRLRNLGRLLDRLRATGPAVELAPPAGTGMPYVVDVGRLRIVLLDTAWWIFDAEPHRKQEMVERLGTAIATARDRHVLIAAHHPYATAGAHGGEVTAWKVLGIRKLLARSGAMLQSLDSRPYNDLSRALREVFARGERPLLFTGGHDHSLQVIRHDSATAPQYTVVAGSASKLTGVGHIGGMLYRESAPGYARVVTRTSGAVDLYMLAAPGEYLTCPDEAFGTGAISLDAERCMREGTAAYRTVFSMRLKQPG